MVLLLWTQKKLSLVAVSRRRKLPLPLPLPRIVIRHPPGQAGDGATDVLRPHADRTSAGASGSEAVKALTEPAPRQGESMPYNAVSQVRDLRTTVRFGAVLRCGGRWPGRYRQACGSKCNGGF